MGNRRRSKRRAALAAGPDTPAEATARAAQRARRALRWIVVFYLFLAGSYAVRVPLGQGPDETAHVRYVEHLARERQLPLYAFDPRTPGANYEFHQPPLYYALCLPTYLLSGGGDGTSQRAARLFTAVLSVGLIYLTFALARTLAPPERVWVPIGAAGVSAFLPMQLHLASSIGNDALSQVLSAAVLLLLVMHLRARSSEDGGKPNRETRPTAMAWIGLMIGLAMLTKSSSVLLFPVAWFTAVFAARSKGGYQWGRLAADIAVVTAVALVVCGWWLALNHRLDHGILGQRSFMQAFQGRRPSPESVMSAWEGEFPPESRLRVYVGLVTAWTLGSTLGVFGPRHDFYPTWIYVAYGLLGAVGALGFARYLGRGNLTAWQRQSWWVCAFYGALLLLSFIRFNFSFFQAQARYLFPLLPAAAAAFCLGLSFLSGPRREPWVVGVAVGSLALLAFLTLPWLAGELLRP